MKIVLFFCVALFALAGCKDNDVHVHPPADIISSPAPTQPASQNGPGPVVATFTSDDIVRLLKAQGIPLAKVNYLAEALPLNNVNPEIFIFTNCDNTPDCKAPHEFLYLYIFNSQEDRAKSIDDLNKQMQKQDEKTRPFVRQNKNAIAIYVHTGTEAGEIQAKIEKALQGWDSPWEVPAIQATEPVAVGTSTSCDTPQKQLELGGKIYELKSKNAKGEPVMKLAYFKCDKGKFTLGDADDTYTVTYAGNPSQNNGDILVLGNWGGTGIWSQVLYSLVEPSKKK